MSAHLSAAALSCHEVFNDYASPSNPCCIRTPMGRRYRHDPYNAKVLASPVCKVLPPVAAAPVAAPSPVKASAPQPVATTVAAAASSSAVRHVIVQFKHETCMYKAPFRVEAGDQVVVTADRGENIGTVQQILADAPTYEVPNTILRHASPSEMAEVTALRHQEDQETTGSVQRLAESIGLGIRVVDTEFQSDMNKLTVYFSSRMPVDFRKLQRSLFRDYRCRIWLVNWSEVETRRKQTDRCMALPLCSKLGSRLSQASTKPHAANVNHAKPSQHTTRKHK